MISAFAEDWFDARGRFIEAAARSGLAVETVWHPSATAPNGAALAADVARAGRADATHVLFTVCGTHGVEGYPGSAAQVALLDSGRLRNLPEHVAVVFLHGLNPWGWSRDSQRNEDGMDINRNFIDFASIPQADTELVGRFAALMDIEEISLMALGQAMRNLFAVRDEVGGSRFMQALSAGQYIEPMGIKFGGKGPSWSNGVYRDVVRRYLGHATHIAEMDWHTGLGEYGGIFPLFFGERGSEEYELTCDWWGRAAVDRGMQSWAIDGDDSPTPDLSGVAHMALVEGVPGARVAGGVIEFGTVPLTQIAQVVFLDHWLLYKARPEADVRWWRAFMRSLMAPRDGAWERSVLAHAQTLFSNTLDGLARWGQP